MHGEAVGVMLPHLIRFNIAVSEIAAIYESYFDGDLADRISELLWEAKMPVKISHYGVKEKDLPALAEMAMKQWTAQFNPRPLKLEDFIALYQAAM